ncbi:hypothetical protein ABT116_01955 [Streptomyces sp. NPDC002130]|uniref:hypothetical protein n=1 Tax=Streptomyces sp. NPDC002130 TaxID=3155568 RepID=UPI00331FCAD1
MPANQSVNPSANEPSGAPAVTRLSRYPKTEQDEILDSGDDPFGVAAAGLT